MKRGHEFENEQEGGYIERYGKSKDKGKWCNYVISLNTIKNNWGYGHSSLESTNLYNTKHWHSKERDAKGEWKEGRS